MSAAFKIGADEFPIPTSFTLADGPLVFEASGLEFGEFAERVDGLADNPSDIRTLTGLVAVAVAHARPHWNRGRVVQFLSSVDLDAFQIEGGDDGPPAEPPTTAEPLSQPSSTASITSAEDTSGVPV